MGARGSASSNSCATRVIPCRSTRPICTAPPIRSSPDTCRSRRPDADFAPGACGTPPSAPHTRLSSRRAPPTKRPRACSDRWDSPLVLDPSQPSRIRGRSQMRPPFLLKGFRADRGGIRRHCPAMNGTPEDILERLARIEASIAGLRALMRGSVPGPQLLSRTLPHFYHDVAVRGFVDARLDRMTVSQLADAARREFGPERAPTRSAIGRYRRRIFKARTPPP